MMEVQQAAESLAAPDLAVLIRRFRRSHEQYIPQALVVPFAMVVGEVLTVVSRKTIAALHAASQ
jgi:hypothetical protein